MKIRTISVIALVNLFTLRIVSIKTIPARYCLVDDRMIKVFYHIGSHLGAIEVFNIAVTIGKRIFRCSQ